MMMIMREMTESMVSMYDTQVRAVAFGSVDGGSGLMSCRRERSTYTMNNGGRPIVMNTRIILLIYANDDESRSTKISSVYTNYV